MSVPGEWVWVRERGHTWKYAPEDFLSETDREDNARLHKEHCSEMLMWVEHQVKKDKEEGLRGIRVAFRNSTGHYVLRTGDRTLCMGGGWRGTIVPIQLLRAGARNVELGVIKIQEKRRAADAEHQALRRLNQLRVGGVPRLILDYGGNFYVGDKKLFATTYEGPTLDYMVRACLLSPLQLLKVFHSAAQTLDQAGRHGYVHRDIHARNICVRADGEASIIDWGCVVEAGTTAWPRGGDWDVCPPEMHSKADKDVEWTHATDVFSLAATFMQCINPPKSPPTCRGAIDCTLHSPCDPKKWGMKRWEPRHPEFVTRGLREYLLRIIAIPPKKRKAVLDMFVPKLNACVHPKVEHRSPMASLQLFFTDLMYILGPAPPQWDRIPGTAGRQ